MVDSIYFKKENADYNSILIKIWIKIDVNIHSFILFCFSPRINHML